MKIKIAGAGAGKTTSMAESIIHLCSETEEYLKIFCITFTNSAAKCIREKIITHYGYIPENIVISTIHSFLYREFIRPYYYLLYNKQYIRISTINLPEKVQYKNYAIGGLESRNILHQTLIPKRAKWIIVKKSNDIKAIKEKRAIILKQFKSYCKAICIDEAQDIDNDMLEIVIALDRIGIPVVLMGDPKQDLNGYKCLRKLVKKYPQATEYITFCHRCPQKHLDLANLIIPEKEKQHSDKQEGIISVIFSSENKCEELVSNGNFDLKYISKKQGIYETHENGKTEDIKENIFEELIVPIREKFPNITELDLMRFSYYLTEKLLKNYASLKNEKEAMKQTFGKIYLDKKVYAKIIDLISKKTQNNRKEVISISSIDVIKGQEGNKCLFILTNDLAEYMFGKKEDDTVFKNKLYVALTRSLNELVIYVTPEVECKYGRDFINKFFQKFL